MYQAPDFVKVELMVKNAFAYTSGCPYDEGTNYTQVMSSVCTGSGSYGYATYIDIVSSKVRYMCFSTRDE